MSQYFSKVYRGFLIEQTDRGWVVPQLPNWSNGPVSQGPYSTYQIACGVLDRVLDNSQRETQTIKTENPKTPVPQQSQSSGVELPAGKAIIHNFIAIPLMLLFILLAGFAVLCIFGKMLLAFLGFSALAAIDLYIAKKVLNYVYS